MQAMSQEHEVRPYKAIKKELRQGAEMFDYANATRIRTSKAKDKMKMGL